MTTLELLVKKLKQGPSAHRSACSFVESHRNDSNPGGAGPNNEGVELLACDVEAAWARTTKYRHRTI